MLRPCFHTVSRKKHAIKLWYFLALCINISKTVQIRTKLLLTTNRKLHALSIGTKVDDLG